MRKFISQPQRLIEGSDGGGTIVTHMRSPIHPQATSDQIASSEPTSPVGWIRLRLDSSQMRGEFVYFSPDKKLTFYSKREVRAFCVCIVRANGDEIAALERHERTWNGTAMPRSRRSLLLQQPAISQASTSRTGIDVSASPSTWSTSLVNVEAAREKLVADTGALEGYVNAEQVQGPRVNEVAPTGLQADHFNPPTAAAAARPYEPVPVGVDGRDGVATAAVAGEDGHDAIQGNVFGENLDDVALFNVFMEELDHMEDRVGVAIVEEV